MLKRVDNACYNTVEAVVKGTFKPGLAVMGLGDKGVAMSRQSELLTFMEFGIGAGKITADDKAKIVENWKRLLPKIPKRFSYRGRLAAL